MLKEQFGAKEIVQPDNVEHNKPMELPDDSGRYRRQNSLMTEIPRTRILRNCLVMQNMSPTDTFIKRMIRDESCLRRVLCT